MSSNTPDNLDDSLTKNVVTLPVAIAKNKTEGAPPTADNSPGLMALKQDSAGLLNEIPAAVPEPDLDREPAPEEVDYFSDENTPEDSLFSLFFPCTRAEFSLLVTSLGSFTLSLFVLLGLLKPFPAILSVLGLLISDALVTGRTKGWFGNTLKFWFRKRPKKKSYQRIFDRPAKTQNPPTRPHLKPVE